MQRQSLGSPSTKNLLNETNIQPSSSSTASPNTKNINTNLLNGKKEEEVKKLKSKANTKTTTTSSHETYIHLIPTLTLLCFLILYLSSHNPSQNDMAQFNGFNHLPNQPSDLGENISELNGAMEMKKGDVLLTIRGLKSDRQSGTVKPMRLHRKIIVNS